MERFTLCFALIGVLMMGLAGCKTTGAADGSDTTPKLAVTADQADAIVQVTGMSCPQCSNNITLIMNKIDEVQASQVDLGAGRVLIAFAPDQSLSAEQIAAIIKDAGFTPGEVSFKAKAGG